MSDAPEAGGSSAMRRSLRRCGCGCVPDPDELATEEDASVDSSNHSATTELVTEEDASVDSSNHCAATQLVSDSQDNSDSTVQLSTETRVTEALQQSTRVTEAVQQSNEVEDTATTHRAALQEEENRTMRQAERTYSLMFLVYCLVGVIISLVAAMVLRTN